MFRYRLPAYALLLTLAFVLLALARPIDHDESQYVAAAVLASHGLQPYRDFAYLQTPLQPLALAPVVRALGAWAWPGMRVLNALFAAGAVGLVFAAARAGGAGERAALAGAGLFAATDILLFAGGTARNDALPALLLAAAVWLVVRQERAPTRPRAALIGFLLAAAAAAKLSYALPLGAYALLALLDRRRAALLVMAGALPPLALVAMTARAAPDSFWFDIWTFPRLAPTQFYADAAWKTSIAGKLGDTLKFLALGPALLAGGLVVAKRRPTVLEWLALAGLVAALLPTPTWRQYLLPALPALFIRLALLWEAAPPTRPVRIAAAVFAAVGLTPSAAALLGGGAGIPQAMRESAALRTAMDGARVFDTVATLSPEFLPATYRLPDPRFAAGPFYFRSHDLLSPAKEVHLHLVSASRLGAGMGVLPEAVVTGGEGPWTSGDAALDGQMERWAAAHGYRRQDVPGTHLRLWRRPG